MSPTGVSKARVQVEAETIVQGVEQVDLAMVKAYVQDLRSLLEEADFAEKKVFLRSFIKRIEVNQKQVTIHYNLPMPQDERGKERVEVLPIDTLGGAEGTRTPALLRAKEALSQLSYSPTYGGIIATRRLVSNLLNTAEVIKWWR
jgi:site-specific DNA recombinase